MIDLIKLLWSAVPFVREMFWPGKTSKEVLASNKMATFVVVVCLMSLSLNYFLMSRIWALAVAKRSEHKEVSVSKPASAVGEEPKPPTASTNMVENTAVASPAASATVDISDADKKAQDDLRARLNALFGKNP